MQATEIPAAAEVSAAAFGLDITDGSVKDRWQRRVAHPLSTDPEGGFVAERDGRIIGVAQAMRRERVWCLSLLAVRPGVQSAGAGRALLARTLDYRAGTDAGLIVSSNDPRALRLYALAGFSLRPTFNAEGPIDRRALPPPHAGVREGGLTDLDAIAAISREIRGAPHTPELEFALGQGAQLVLLEDRGFAATIPGQGVWLLAALDQSAATALLWRALEIAAEARRPLIRWITAGQDWAIDVAVRAGLQLSAYGALCVSGDPGPLAPFVPSGPFA